MTGLLHLGNTRPSRGFTLVEIAIVMVIVGLLLAGVSSQFGTYADNDRYSSTQDYLADARKAMLDYAGVNGYLPCPDTDNDGEGNTGTPACASAEGTLPYVELGLRARTNWEAPVLYAIHQEAASGAAADNCSPVDHQQTACFFDSSSFNLKTGVSTPGDLEVKDSTDAGAQTLAQNLLAVLVSYGSNSQATFVDCAVGGRSDDEDENCDTDTDFILAITRAAEAPEPFDDQLVWLSEFDLKEAKLDSVSVDSDPLSQNPFLDQVTDPDANYPDPDNIPTECPAGPELSCQDGKNGKDTITGTDEDDLLLGGNGKDSVLDGGDGDDIVYGGNGKDELYGGDGNDLLVGGKANDILHGGADHDLLYGSEGKDVLYGGGGDDILLGGDGDDQLYGGPGVDIVYGGPGKDDIIYNAAETGDAVDLLDGRDGEDTLWVDSSLGSLREVEQGGVRTVIDGVISLDPDKPGALYIDNKKWAEFTNMEKAKLGTP